MNHKTLVIAANLKALLEKEGMVVDSSLLINDKNYSIVNLKRALLSSNQKVIALTNDFISEMNFDKKDFSNQTILKGVNETSQEEKMRLLKEKYKKDSGR